MELEQKVEELEGVLAQLKVDIQEILVDLKELSLRGQDPMNIRPANESVARVTM